jgi:D-sedoheptulose 7-phosphate isomerase
VHIKRYGDTMEYITDYMVELKKTIDCLPAEAIDRLVSVLEEARSSRRQVFIMGNGGSASTASHFVADLSKNTRSEGWPGYRVIGLTDNMAILSAFANDEGYENVFAGQLANLVCPGDLVIAISASGNSPNVLKAVDLARCSRATTIGLTGFDGGKLGRIVDLHIHVASKIIEQVEDIHLMIEHLVVKTLRERSRKAATAYPSRVPLQAPGMSERSVEPARAGALSMELLYTLSREVNPEMALPVLLQKVLSMTLERVGASSGSFVVFDESGQVQQAALAYAGRIDFKISQELADVIEHGLAGWVVENRQAALVSSTLDDPRWLPNAWEQDGAVSRSALSVPVLVHERVAGVITLVRSEQGGFSAEHIVLLTSIALFLSLNRSGVLDRSQN